MKRRGLVVIDRAPNQIHWSLMPMVSRHKHRLMKRVLVYCWTMPTSAVALPVILLNGMLGGQVFVWNGIVEVHGPGVRWVLNRRMIRASAMTLGHVILCLDEPERQKLRPHELVHVQQAEVWGAMFLPMYLWLGFASWRRTGHAYWHHPWEVEARDRSGI